MNVFLPAEIGFGTLDGFCQRGRLERECRLAGAVFVAGTREMVSTPSSVEPYTSQLCNPLK